MVLFSLLYNAGDWQSAIYGSESFLMISDLMFGDVLGYSAGMGPIFPDDTTQPTLDLPFLSGSRWNFTGGPHGGWGKYTPWSAIDFAPSGQSGCIQADQLVSAAAEAAVVVRHLDKNSMPRPCASAKRWNSLRSLPVIIIRVRLRRAEILTVGGPTSTTSLEARHLWDPVQMGYSPAAGLRCWLMVATRLRS